MTDNNGPYLFYYAILAVMMGSALLSRRIPLGTAAKMALAWIAIFGAAFIVFAFRSDFSALGSRLKAEAIGASVDDGKELRIPIADDGHYYVEGLINGHSARFMVDSGASVTTVSKATASAAGIATDGRRAVVDTANGPASVVQATADRLEVGSIARSDFPVDVSDQDDLNLIGMTFLSSLNSWGVEGNYLVLRP